MKIRNVEIDEDTQKKIASCCALNITASFKYVPQVWRESGLPKDMWPVFTLRGKDGVESAEIEDKIGVMSMLDGKPVQRITAGSVRIATLTAGIESVQNLAMPDGTLLNYKYDAGRGIAETWLIDESGKEKDRTVCARQAIVKYLSPTLQVELQNAINEMSTMTAEELQGL